MLCTRWKSHGSKMMSYDYTTKISTVIKMTQQKVMVVMVMVIANI